MTAVKFYLDENMPVAIADQLRQRGIDTVTVRDIGKLRDSDMNHFTRATSMGHVLCTHDHDFLRLAHAGHEHAGIVFGQQDRMSIGAWVRALTSIHARFSAEAMINRVEFI